MNQDGPKPVDVKGLLGWTMLPGLLVFAGAMAMCYWLYGPGRDMLSAAVAFCIVLVLVIGGAMAARQVILYSTAKARSAGRPANVAFLTSQAFTALSMLRMLACVGIGLGAWKVLALPGQLFFLWLVVFYLVLMIGEKVWLIRTLRRDRGPGGPQATR